MARLVPPTKLLARWRQRVGSLWSEKQTKLRSRSHRTERRPYPKEDLLDFSGRDDEYLDRELAQKALAFALVSSVVGFAFSAFLFLGQKLGPASEILDRRAAEGRVVKGGGRSEEEYIARFGGFTAPRLRESKPREKRRPAWSDLEEVGPPQPAATLARVDRPASKRRSEKTASEEKPKSQSLARVQARAEQPQPSLALDRLVFPRVDQRADRGSLSALGFWSQNAVSLANHDGQTQVGFGIDSSGRALVSSAVATPEFLNRIWVGGTLRRGTLLQTDSALGVALIRVEDAGFANVVLSPAPPARGERLLTFFSRQKSAAAIEVRAGLTFGLANFFVEGPFGGQSLGAPLLNDRGEVVGCYVHSLPGAPGGGIHLASDSAALYRLVRGYSGGGSVGGLESSAARRLEELLTDLRQRGESKRGRIVPGIGLTDFHLGMTPGEAEKWLSTPEKQSLGNFEIWRSPAPPVLLYFANGRLAVAATEHTGFSTPEGLAAGSRLNVRSLLAAYPGLELYPGLALAAGLDIVFDSGERVRGIVVKPEIAR